MAKRPTSSTDASGSSAVSSRSTRASTRRAASVPPPSNARRRIDSVLLTPRKPRNSIQENSNQKTLSAGNKLCRRPSLPNLLSSSTTARKASRDPKSNANAAAIPSTAKKRRRASSISSQPRNPDGTFARSSTAKPLSRLTITGLLTPVPSQRSFEPIARAASKKQFSQDSRSQPGSPESHPLSKRPRLALPVAPLPPAASVTLGDQQENSITDYPDEYAYDADFQMLDMPDIVALPWVAGPSRESSIYMPPGVRQLIDNMKHALDLEGRARRHAEEKHFDEMRKRIAVESVVEKLENEIRYYWRQEDQSASSSSEVHPRSHSTIVPELYEAVVNYLSQSAEMESFQPWTFGHETATMAESLGTLPAQEPPRSDGSIFGSGLPEVAEPLSDSTATGRYRTSSTQTQPEVTANDGVSGPLSYPLSRQATPVSSLSSAVLGARTSESNTMRLISAIQARINSFLPFNPAPPIAPRMDLPSNNQCNSPMQLSRDLLTGRLFHATQAPRRRRNSN